MGTFNTITILESVACPSCGIQISEFQSKLMSYQGYPIDGAMLLLQLNEDMTGEIHTTCSGCEEPISFSVIHGTLEPYNAEKLEHILQAEWYKTPVGKFITDSIQQRYDE